MGATSVTGVGQGSVEGMDMGRKEYTVAANRLVGPRVIAADQKVLVSGAATVVLPKLSGVVGDYIVLVANKTSAVAVGGVLTFGANDTTVTLAGTGTNTVQWAIVKAGLMP